MTWAGPVFLDEAHRLLFTLEQAFASTKAASTSYSRHAAHRAVGGIDPLRLAALRAQYREEEPDVEIRLFEIPLRNRCKACSAACMTLD